MNLPPPIPPPIIRTTPRPAPAGRQHDPLVIATFWLSSIACAAALAAATLSGIHEWRYQRAMSAIDDFNRIGTRDSREDLEQEYRDALRDVTEAWEAASRDY